MSLNPTQVLFSEEPLNLSAHEGAGFYPARLGETFKDGRYQVLRKLGFGQFSNTWLAKDTQCAGPDCYVAIKILTAVATAGHSRKFLLELELLQRIQSAPPSSGRDRLSTLKDHFELQGPHGKHLCFALQPLGASLKTLHETAPDRILPQPIAKRIVKQILQALVYLHDTCRIIHTDIKPDNILFHTDSLKGEIGSGYQPHQVFQLGTQSYPILRSQPISVGLTLDSDPALFNVSLSDLGHSQWADKPMSSATIQPYRLRAPEVILEAGFNTSADIWNLGCLAFELSTGRWLFDPRGGENFSIEGDHIAQMMAVTGENFGSELLLSSRRRSLCSGISENPLEVPKRPSTTFEDALGVYKCLSPENIADLASFLRACLRLNPRQRATASGLLEHSWLQDV